MCNEPVVSLLSYQQSAEQVSFGDVHYLRNFANERRAWLLCGLAVRHALTLGLHVKSTAQTLSDADKEYRVRSWWALYSLECTLNELTGRPTCIADRDISAPMPINVEESDLGTEQALYDRMEGLQSDQSSPPGVPASHSSKCMYNSHGRKLSNFPSQPCCHLPNANRVQSAY